MKAFSIFSPCDDIHNKSLCAALITTPIPCSVASNFLWIPFKIKEKQKAQVFTSDCRVKNRKEINIFFPLCKIRFDKYFFLLLFLQLLNILILKNLLFWKGDGIEKLGEVEVESIQNKILQKYSLHASISSYFSKIRNFNSSSFSNPFLSSFSHTPNFRYGNAAFSSDFFSPMSFLSFSSGSPSYSSNLSQKSSAIFIINVWLVSCIVCISDGVLLVYVIFVKIIIFFNLNRFIVFYEEEAIQDEEEEAIQEEKEEAIQEEEEETIQEEEGKDKIIKKKVKKKKFKVNENKTLQENWKENCFIQCLRRKSANKTFDKNLIINNDELIVINCEGCNENKTENTYNNERHEHLKKLNSNYKRDESQNIQSINNITIEENDKSVIIQNSCNLNTYPFLSTIFNEKQKYKNIFDTHYKSTNSNLTTLYSFSSASSTSDTSSCSSYSLLPDLPCSLSSCKTSSHSFSSLLSSKFLLDNIDLLTCSRRTINDFSCFTSCSSSFSSCSSSFSSCSSPAVSLSFSSLFSFSKILSFLSFIFPSIGMKNFLFLAISSLFNATSLFLLLFGLFGGVDTPEWATLQLVGIFVSTIFSVFLFNIKLKRYHYLSLFFVFLGCALIINLLGGFSFLWHGVESYKSNRGEYVWFICLGKCLQVVRIFIYETVKYQIESRQKNFTILTEQETEIFGLENLMSFIFLILAGSCFMTLKNCWHYLIILLDANWFFFFILLFFFILIKISTNLVGLSICAYLGGVEKAFIESLKILILAFLQIFPKIFELIFGVLKLSDLSVIIFDKVGCFLAIIGICIYTEGIKLMHNDRSKNLVPYDVSASSYASFLNSNKKYFVNNNNSTGVNKNIKDNNETFSKLNNNFVKSSCNIFSEGFKSKKLNKEKEKLNYCNEREIKTEMDDNFIFKNFEEERREEVRRIKNRKYFKTFLNFIQLKILAFLNIFFNEDRNNLRNAEDDNFNLSSVIENLPSSSTPSLLLSSFSSSCCSANYDESLADECIIFTSLPALLNIPVGLPFSCSSKYFTHKNRGFLVKRERKSKDKWIKAIHRKLKRLKLVKSNNTDDKSSADNNSDSKKNIFCLCYPCFSCLSYIYFFFFPQQNRTQIHFIEESMNLIDASAADSTEKNECHREEKREKYIPPAFQYFEIFNNQINTAISDNSELIQNCGDTLRAYNHDKSFTGNYQAESSSVFLRRLSPSQVDILHKF